MKWSISALSLLACAALVHAQTQAPLTCSGTASTAPAIRAEGGAELVGDYILKCTGGIPTPGEAAVPTRTLTLTLNTNVTSRALAPGWSEALLLVDEPSARQQSACASASGVCTLQGTGNGLGTYSGANGQANIFQAQVSASSPNQVVISGFPFDPPGSGTRTLRFTNLRVNTVGTQLANIQASLAISGVTITSPSQVLASIQPGTALQAKFVQSSANGISQFTMNLTERFPAALKTRSSAAFVNSETSPAPATQNVPGTSYAGSESGFHSDALPTITGRGNLGSSGVADSGTRLLVSVGPIPPGVTLSTYTGANLTAGGSNSGVLRLIAADGTGSGAFTPAGSCCGSLALTPDANGTVRAVFEVLSANPQAVETVDIPFVLSYAAGAPAVTSLSVSASPAPTSTVTVSDAASPLPRFNAPQTFPLAAIMVSPASLPPANAGVQYSLQFSAAGGSPPYSWTPGSSLPAGLTLNGSGLLGGTLQSTGTFNLTVVVGDAAQNSATIQYGLSVGTGSSIQIAPSLLPNGAVGSAYSQTLSATGGTAPYTFSSPSLPVGLQLNPSGVLSGTPASTGAPTITVNVTDASKATASKQYPFTIAPALDVTNPSPLPNGSAGAPYSVTFTPTGGTPPYTFTSGNLPAGLSLSPGGVLTGAPVNAGTVSLAIVITDSAKNSATKSFTVTFGTSAPALTVSRATLSFTATVGGDAPPPEDVSVLSSAGPVVTFRMEIDGGSANTPAPAWLSTYLSSGVTPANLRITANQAGLGVGTYNARLRFFSTSGSSTAPVDVPVTLAVTAATQQLEVTPAVVKLKSRVNAPGIQDVYLTVRNSAGGGAIPFTVSALLQSPWIIEITPSSASTTPNAPLTLHIRIDTQGLSSGSHRDVIRFTWAGTTIDLPLSVFVSDPGPIIAVDVTAQRFESNQGGGYTIPQAVRVANVGDPGTTVNFTAEVLNGGSWLAVGDGSVVTGSVPAGQSVPVTLSGTAASADRPVGGSYGLVRISDPNALNSPQYVVIVLDQAAATDPVVPNFSPAPLVLTIPAGSGVQSAQTKVYASSPTPEQYYAAAATDDNGSWLIVSPSSGAATATAPGVINLQVNPAGLAVGIHKGQINITMSGLVRTKDVTVIITPASSPTASVERRAASGPAAACAPAKLAVTQAGIAQSFAIPAGWPATLIVQLTDDCGSPVTNASMSANFSNGDPPLSLDSDRITGAYTGTWQPGIVTQQMTVTIRATAAGLAQATAQISGAINPNTAPVLFKNGTVNAFSRTAAGALTPGTVVEVYGTGLAAAPDSVPSVPLPTDFRNTSMLVGSFAAPIFFVSAGQLDVQIPAELKANQQYPVIISANGALTIPDTIDVVTVQPGAAQFPDGTIIAQHSVDFSLVDAGHPAKPGEVLTMYLVGMGPTSVTVASGNPAPGGPFAEATVKPTVTVDSQPADVSFAGLTPGGVGLFQINFKVPDSAASGNLQVVVTQGTVTSNVTALPVQR